MKIISLRGCSGAGKSTVAYHFLQNYPTTPLLDEKGKVEAYRTDIPGKAPLYTIGRYTTPTGGCDTVPTQEEICRRVRKYAPEGNVLFEGLLLSGAYGTVGKLSEEYPERFIFATLDTPLDLALERVKQRRAAKGNFEPMNPKNTTSKFDSTRAMVKRLETMGNKTHVWIDHTNAVQQVLGLME